MARIQYDCANLTSSLSAARCLAGERGVAYVSPTALGYMVTLTPPPFHSSHYHVTATAVTLRTYQHETATWKEESK